MKLGTGIDRPNNYYGHLFSKYFKTCQLLSYRITFNLSDSYALYRKYFID